MNPRHLPGPGDYERFGPTDHPLDPRNDGPDFDEEGNLLDENGYVVMTAREVRRAIEEDSQR